MNKKNICDILSVIMMSDEFTNPQAQEVEADKKAADSVASENNQPIYSAEGNDGAPSQVGELVSVAVKSIAVALSVVMLIMSILTVAMPLSAMRVFNKLGMYERALTSGTRYIESELSSRNADVDKLGKYVEFLSEYGDARATEMSSIKNTESDEDFIEALEVCISLSDKLMRESYAKGDYKSAAHFGDYLEKYTRYFLSLTNVSTVLADKDAQNYVAFAPLMRPYVYSYRHTLVALNYRARVITGETDHMLYDGGRNGDCVQSLANRSNTYNGTDIFDKDGNMRISTIDEFVDYVYSLTESIAVEMERLGIDEAPTGSVVPVKYLNVLTGEEFALFVNRTAVNKDEAFTSVYKNLRRFSEYAQAAVDYSPANADEQLRQLFWLQRLITASNRLWYMEELMYFNHTAYGYIADAVYNEFGQNTCENYKFVEYDLGYGMQKCMISDVYTQRLLPQYLDNFKG